MCFDRTDKQTGKKLIGYIDTGLKQNYILRSCVKHGDLITLQKSLSVPTINGHLDILHCVMVNLFSHDLIFLVIDNLGDFDLVLGMNGLTQINAILDVMSFRLIYTVKNQKIEKLFESKNRPIISNKNGTFLTQIKNKIHTQLNQTHKSNSPRYNNSFYSNGSIMRKCLLFFRKFISNELDCCMIINFETVLSNIKQMKYFYKKFIKILNSNEWYK